MGKIIIVSNRLPVRIQEKKGSLTMLPGEGGLATGLGCIYKQGSNIWVGWPGAEIQTPERKQEVSERLAKMNLMPVFLTKEEINKFYEGFSNEILWPIFHYMPTYAKFDPEYWETYFKVNLKFKEAVLQIAEPDDIIWVHDYQLLLLPGMLRSELPDSTIGFFQHIPFPSYELFRLIPWRTELLEGMLGADLVGFHTFDDARHFVTTVSRILPVSVSSNIITVGERSVTAEPFSMGIDFKKFETLANDQRMLRHIQSLRKNFNHVKVILSVDRLDYSKGILQRLQAYEQLLQSHPEYAEKVILCMVVVPSRDTVPQYKELRDSIDQLVGNINARFRTLGWHPIHYFYRSFTKEMLSALYTMADVCLVTPMRDGMNLVSKEYVASRIHNDGVLILSEMAGASKELIDALVVNPNDTKAVKEAILEALNMPLEEQQRRMRQMRQLISKFDIKHWLELFMARLKEVKVMQQSMLAKRIGRTTLKAIQLRYGEARKRLLFLDYDGTLVAFKTNIDMASPDEELFGLLRRFASDPANRVVIVSGRKYKTLEAWLGSIPLDMIAEHGAWQKHHGGVWESVPGLTDQWKSEILPVLEVYADRTPGAFVEEKSYSLVWHFRKVEEGLGDLRAAELMSTLRYLIADKGLQLLQGNKVIEVKNLEVNKGRAASGWLEKEEYDFILAIGDDYTDEDLFKAMPENAIIVRVGSYVSAAKYYIRSYAEVRDFLEILSSSVPTTADKS